MNIHFNTNILETNIINLVSDQKAIIETPRLKLLIVIKAV